MTLRESWFAVRVGVWLCLLPVSLHRSSLPELLRRATLVRKLPPRRALHIDRVVAIVSLLCDLHLFRWPIFPKPCLRHSLALFRALIQIGYSPEIHFGVRKAHELIGHSWVTLRGHPVPTDSRSGSFKPIYSYSSGSSSDIAQA